MRHTKPRFRQSHLVTLLILTSPTLYLVLLSKPLDSSNAFLPDTHPQLATFLEHLHPSVTSLSRLAKLSPPARADTLELALRAWRHSTMPPTVLVAAAVCSRKIAVEALFRGQVTGVIDVGAADGYPVTSLALSREAKWVLSCENSPKYNRLRRLSGPGFHHINLLPGNSRRNPSIIHVLHTANITGDAGDVRKKTFISRGTISLIAIRGKESDAFLEGAVPILPAVNNVLLEISADRNASSALHILFNAGFECAHLAFNHKGKVHPFFGRNSINAESVGQFLQFMAKHAKFVDVLCSKRATTG